MPKQPNIMMAYMEGKDDPRVPPMDDELKQKLFRFRDRMLAAGVDNHGADEPDSYPVFHGGAPGEAEKFAAEHREIVDNHPRYQVLGSKGQKSFALKLDIVRITQGSRHPV